MGYQGSTWALLALDLVGELSRCSLDPCGHARSKIRWPSSLAWLWFGAGPAEAPPSAPRQHRWAPQGLLEMLMAPGWDAHPCVNWVCELWSSSLLLSLVTFRKCGVYQRTFHSFESR